MAKYARRAQAARGRTSRQTRQAKMRRNPMSTKLIRQPMLTDHALTPLNYATYDFSYVQDLFWNSDPVGGTPREYSIAFARFQPAGIATSVYSFNTSPKWAVVSPNWEQCAVTDVRLTFMPTNLVGTLDRG